MADKLIAILSLLILLGGCSTLSIRMAMPMVESQYAAINEETDPVLAEQAIPASLKMMEGMLREDMLSSLRRIPIRSVPHSCT